MNRLPLLLFFIFLFSSCQQRYWQVKKVRVNPILSTQKETLTAEPVLISPILTSTPQSDSLQAVNPPTIQQTELSKEEVESEIDTIKKAANLQPDLINSLTIIPAQESLNLDTPEINEDEKPITKAEFLFMIYQFMLVLILFGVLYLVIFSFAVFALIFGSGDSVLILLLFLLILFLFLSFQIGSYFIKKRLKKQISLGTKLLSFLAAMLVIFLLVRLAFLLSSFAVLFMVGIIALLVGILSEFKPKTDEKIEDNSVK